MNGDRARRFLVGLIDEIRSGDFPYDSKTPQKRDWSQYDRAQINEITDTLELIKTTVNRAWTRTPQHLKQRTGPGQPPTPAPDLVKALLVQQYFGASNRQAQGLVNLFREKLGIQSDFSYKTIERAYAYEHVRELMDRVFDETVHAVSDKEEALGFDGTGLPTSLKTNYENDKTSTKRGTKKAHWEYIITGMGLKTQLFTDITILGSPHGSESPHLVDVLPEPGLFPNVKLGVADAGFLSRANVQSLHDLGMTPRIFPKRNVSFRSEGSSAWAPMLRAFIQDPWTWMREYHQRSIAETGYSTFKRAFPKPLRKKLQTRRHGEIHARKTASNLRRLSYLHHIEQWTYPWDDKAGG